MIELNSVLRNLPQGLDPKQALPIDGLRHAAEIAHFAYGRLKQTLTEIALSEMVGAPGPFHLYPAAFLDAWSIVDALDRFRALWAVLPSHLEKPSDVGPELFSSQHIRNLRNVADHIGTRIDYVAAKRGAALGILHWVTMTRPELNEGLMCVLIPGTVNQGNVQHHTAPVGREIELPSGYVRLKAGEYESDLSAVMPELEQRVRELETNVRLGVDAIQPPLPTAPADMLIRMNFVINPEPKL